MNEAGSGDDLVRRKSADAAVTTVAELHALADQCHALGLTLDAQVTGEVAPEGRVHLCVQSQQVVTNFHDAVAAGVRGELKRLGIDPPSK